MLRFQRAPQSGQAIPFRRLLHSVTAGIVIALLLLTLPGTIRFWFLDEAAPEDGGSPQGIADRDNDLDRHAALPEGVFRVAQIPTEPTMAQAPPAQPGSLPDLPFELFDAVRDNTPSRRQEHEAWFRSLATIGATPMTKLLDRQPITVGFRELSQQPDKYRGQLITLQGTLHRIQRLEAPANDFGIASYWQCWLRPSSANDPVVVYAPTLPAELAKETSSPSEVNVVGVFFKLWAYRSELGLRTAPLVIGQIAPIPANERRRDAIADSDARPSRDRRTAPSSPVTPGDDEATPLRRVWELMGFDDTWWSQFTDGPEVNDQEQSAISTLLRELTRVPRSSLERDQQPLPPGDQWLEQIASLRGTSVTVAGSLLSSRQVAEGYHRSRIQVTDSDTVVDVITSGIPQGLQTLVSSAGDLSESVPFEQVHATAIPLKIVDDAKGAQMLMVAPRLAWQPLRVQPEAGIQADHIFLARLGFDVGLLDDVKSRSELSWLDRESFYQLLDVMRRVRPESLSHSIGAPIPVSELLRNEERYRGRLCEFVGNARSVTRIAVDDPDIRIRFGIDHYYEVVVFVQPDAPIQYVGAGEGRKEFATYPIVFCSPRIPAGLPVGIDERIAVQIRGAFLKNWAYPSAFITGAEPGSGRHPLQFSPLLIGPEPDVLPVPKVQVSGLDRLVLALFLGGLLGLAVLIWWFGRQDRRADRRRRASSLPKRIELPPPAE